MWHGRGGGKRRLPPRSLLPHLSLFSILMMAPPKATADSGCATISACTDSEWAELALDPSAAVQTLDPGCWRVTPPVADGRALKLGKDYVLEGRSGGGKGDGM